MDCLPLSKPVANPLAPSSQEHVVFCRQMASQTLQHLYKQASVSLAPPAAAAPAPPVPVTPSAMQTAVAQARSALMQALDNGQLEAALSEVMTEPVDVREKMKDVLVGAMEDGRLEQALRESKVERACLQARQVLIDAVDSGRLEAAINEVSMAMEVPVAVCAAPAVPMSPAPPSGCPTRRPFAGGRNVVASPAPTSAASDSQAQPVAPSAPKPPSCGSPRKARPATMLSMASEDVASATEPSAPAVPQAPKTPIQPGGTRPGVRRPCRASTLSISVPESAEEQVHKEEPPTPPAVSASQPLRRRPGSARGRGPTALELDLQLEAGSMSAASGPTGAMTPRGAEKLRLARAAATHDAAPVGWSMDTIEHLAGQQNYGFAAKHLPSESF